MSFPKFQVNFDVAHTHSSIEPATDSHTELTDPYNLFGNANVLVGWFHGSWKLEAIVSLTVFDEIQPASRFFTVGNVACTVFASVP
jgi:hypothetical protein